MSRSTEVNIFLMFSLSCLFLIKGHQRQDYMKDIGLISLHSEYPGCCIIESTLSCTMRSLDEKSNLAFCITIIVHSSNLLTIYIEGDAVPISNNCNAIKLSCSYLNSWAIRVCQADNITVYSIHILKEPVSSITANYKEIESICVLIPPEDDSAAIAIDNLHIHLESKIAEIGKFCIA